MQRRRSGLRPSTSDEVATRHRPAPLCPSCGAKRYGTFLRAIFDDSKKDLPTFSLLHRADVLQRAFRGHRKDLWAEPQDCLRVAPARVCDRGRLRAGPQARPVQAKAVHRRGHRRLQARARRRARQAFPRIRDSLRSHIAKGSTVVGSHTGPRSGWSKACTRPTGHTSVTRNTSSAWLS